MSLSFMWGFKLGECVWTELVHFIGKAKSTDLKFWLDSWTTQSLLLVITYTGYPSISTEDSLIDER